MEVVLPSKPDPITLDIDRTALIVVDMQNAFAKKGGMFDYLGAFNEARANRAIDNSIKIIEAFRRRRMNIIYLRMTYGPDLADGGGEAATFVFGEKPASWNDLRAEKDLVIKIE